MLGSTPRRPPAMSEHPASDLEQLDIRTIERALARHLNAGEGVRSSLVAVPPRLRKAPLETDGIGRTRRMLPMDGWTSRASSCSSKLWVGSGWCLAGIPGSLRTLGPRRTRTCGHGVHHRLGRVRGGTAGGRPVTSQARADQMSEDGSAASPKGDTGRGRARRGRPKRSRPRANGDAAEA